MRLRTRIKNSPTWRLWWPPCLRSRCWPWRIDRFKKCLWWRWRWWILRRIDRIYRVCTKTDTMDYYYYYCMYVCNAYTALYTYCCCCYYCRLGCFNPDELQYFCAYTPPCVDCDDSDATAELNFSSCAPFGAGYLYDGVEVYTPVALPTANSVSWSVYYNYRRWLCPMSVRAVWRCVSTWQLCVRPAVCTRKPD